MTFRENDRIFLKKKIRLTQKRKWFHDIKRKRKEKGQEKKIPKIPQRTSTHILVNPRPHTRTKYPIYPTIGTEMAYGPTDIRSACLQKGLTVDGTGAYDILSYHQERRGPHEPPWATWVTSIGQVWLSSQSEWPFGLRRCTVGSRVDGAIGWQWLSRGVISCVGGYS